MYSEVVEFDDTISQYFDDLKKQGNIVSYEISYDDIGKEVVITYYLKRATDYFTVEFIITKETENDTCKN